MQLSPLQLQIQERADKTLSFGCMFLGLCGDDNDIVICKYVCKDLSGKDLYLNDVDEPVEYKVDTKNIIGHPMNRGRLCYLSYQVFSSDICIDALPNKFFKARNKVIEFFDKDKVLYQQTVLERPEELQNLVLKFLLTLPKS